MIDRDVAVVICSRGREATLTRLLTDLRDGFAPALAAGGLSTCIFVYAQGYSAEYLAGLDAAFADLMAKGGLVVMASTRPHARIGDVVHTAVGLVHGRARYRIAMLMDDDSVYEADPAIDANLREAARAFIAQGARAFSIKLGAERALDYVPFLNPDDPIMPFKEKMMWVSRSVLDEAVAVPRFTELSIGEDAVIAAVAWLADPAACLGVRGIATFLHLGFEGAPGMGALDVEGGYADLMDYKGPPPDAVEHHGKYDEAIRRGVTPYHVLPDLFVGEDHPRYVFNGVRGEVIARMRAAGMLPSAELGANA